MGILLRILLAVVLIVVLSVVLHRLWNMTLPEVFGLKPISYWQALRLLLIASILFGGAHMRVRAAEMPVAIAPSGVALELDRASALARPAGAGHNTYAFALPTTWKTLDARRTRRIR